MHCARTRLAGTADHAAAGCTAWPSGRRVLASAAALALLMPVAAMAARPLVSETADALERGRCELEGAALGVQARGEPRTRALDLLVACGIGWDTQLSAAYSRARAGNQTGQGLTLAGNPDVLAQCILHGCLLGREATDLHRLREEFIVDIDIGAHGSLNVYKLAQSYTFASRAQASRSSDPCLAAALPLASARLLSSEDITTWHRKNSSSFPATASAPRRWGRSRS